VLLVDDDGTSRKVVEAMLRADAYELVLASSGEEAIQHVAGPTADLVICDVMMPGVDGYEVCRAMRAHPAWRFVPVILLTALDGPDDLVRGIEAGAEEFLVKPVNRLVLRARVRAMLHVRQRFRELESAAAAVDVESLLQARRRRIAAQAGMSDREREVLELLLLGRNHHEIGTALGITERTARFHQASILKKLGADSRVDLARIFL
jgi:DNA-binding NarL/FixJ family response regulator